ncbi:metallophosphoesterase [Allokutzneria sp. NRRL B-24872]|uniref:metallophosphoesterase family protein n=1 Tax=Allokutzneria sp. NRRL B-24872 TaxID=1137961 RepID=UPI0011777413|nr:metallophosphoesterase [Allokutzneria sp. NRRL B-24872]
MRIAFIGDVHGRVLHTLGALAALQNSRGVRLDAAIQVGDLGAYPTWERMDRPSKRFAEENPAENDFFRLLDPSPRLADAVRSALALLPPVHFVSGNHEDFEWLAGLHEAAGERVVPVDPLGAFHHVECGHQITVAEQRIAFLGKIEEPGHMDLDEDARASLLAAEPGSVDVLVTHDGPFGMCRNWRGELEGSPKLAELIEHLQPRVHVSGHYHHENGPRHYGRTDSYALAELVYPKTNRRRPERANPEQRVAEGSIGLLDTETGTFEYVHDAWLADVCGDDLDLSRFLMP